MEAKFTPGPWKYVRESMEDDGWVVIPTDKMLSEYNVAKSIESRENARLIAAAPAMYEALRAMLAVADGLNFPAANQARAAIAAAEGRSI